jgi:hypothetical protein
MVCFERQRPVDDGYWGEGASLRAAASKTANGALVVLEKFSAKMRSHHNVMRCNISAPRNDRFGSDSEGPLHVLHPQARTI